MRKKCGTYWSICFYHLCWFRLPHAVAVGCCLRHTPSEKKNERLTKSRVTEETKNNDKNDRRIYQNRDRGTQERHSRSLKNSFSNRQRRIELLRSFPALFLNCSTTNPLNACTRSTLRGIGGAFTKSLYHRLKRQV